MCCVSVCRFARIGSTWRWCWIVSSFGYLLWLSLLAQQPSFCKRPPSTTTANPSTSNSPRFSALSGIDISTKMQFKINLFSLFRCYCVIFLPSSLCFFFHSVCKHPSSLSFYLLYLFSRYKMFYIYLYIHWQYSIYWYIIVGAIVSMQIRKKTAK